MTYQTATADITSGLLQMAASEIAEPRIDSLVRCVRIHILSPDKQTTCQYWLGLYRHGSLKAADILKTDNIRDIFENAVDPGINETKHVMIADTLGGESRILSLIPASSNPDAPIDQNSLNEAQKTITSWPPETLGICLSPQIVSASSARQLTIDLISTLIEHTKISDFVVDPGAFGHNHALNVAITVKKNCCIPNTTTFVFH